MATLFLSFRVGLLVFLMFNRDLLKVFYYAILDTPFQEIELRTRRSEPMELDAFRSAKRVKELFTVSVQTRLVGHVDREHLAGRGGVRHVVRLGVIRDEPFELAEGYTLAVPQNIVKFLAIFWYIKKFREARQENIRLAHYFLELSNL